MYARINCRFNGSMTKNVKGGLGARGALRPVGGSARLAQNAREETLRGGGGGGGGRGKDSRHPLRSVMASLQDDSEPAGHMPESAGRQTDRQTNLIRKTPLYSESDSALINAIQPVSSLWTHVFFFVLPTKSRPKFILPNKNASPLSVMACQY